MRVGIDLDGVVLDLHSAFLDRYERWFGFPAGPLEGWDDMLDRTHFSSWDEVWAWADRANLWDNLEYVPGAPGGIDDLFLTGHSIVFLTSRSGRAAEAAARWHRASPWAKDTSIRTGLGDSKYTVPCSVYIDDSPAVLEGLMAQGKRAIRFARPWNEDVDTGEVADDWSDVVTLILSGEDS